MPKLTLQQKLTAALTLEGYKQVRKQGKYLRFEHPEETKILLLGSAGACRWTKGSIANSHPIPTSLYQKLLEKAESTEGL